MNLKIKSHQFINYLLVFLILSAGAANAKAPAVGTVIKNQATATYKDSAGFEQTVASNLVETLIQQVGAFILESDQSRYGVAGQSVSFPHILTNTGNGDDTFLLSATDLQDQYNFTDINIYPDENQDGIPDSLTSITSTGVLALEEAFYFVVVATVADTAADTETGKILVSGESVFSAGAEIITKTDTAIVSDKAVVLVTKSISANSGDAGSGDSYTVTLTYSNPSGSDATSVTLIDALPDGMSYVAGSGAWSVDTGLVLTDDGTADLQGSGTETIVYCAYDDDCSGLTESDLDGDSVSTNQVTATISTVESGNSGTISFKVTLDDGLEASKLYNTGEFEYFNGLVTIPDQITNKVPMEILSQPGVVANDSESDSTDNTNKVPPTIDGVEQTSVSLGGTASFDNVIWNTGNTTDTFDITIDEPNSFPTGTTFMLYKSDGFSPLLDTDNSGEVDTGPLEAGESYVVVLKAKISMDSSTLTMTDSVADNGDSGFEVTKTATSAIDESVFNSVTDHLDEITGSTVDLTNVAPLGGDGVKGVGDGPLPDAQSLLILAPGESGVFKLYANNTSSVTDSFNLSYSKDKPFVAGTLPDGWKVAFHADAGATNCSTLGSEISNTALVAPGSSKLICAKVTMPTDTAFVGSSTSIYFRVLSPLTGATDTKHDAVYMTAAQKLILEPDNQGQVEPGNSVVYTHIIRNSGNTVFTDITFSSTDTLSDDGWATVLYEDTDGDGILTNADAVVSTLTLAIDESKTIFAKVFAPANTPLGLTNYTDIIAVGTTDAGTSVDITVSAKDSTYVSKSSMNITKEQAPDADCDGAVDSGKSYSFDGFQAQPKTCVMYRLTATNNSANVANNVRINDAIPEYTSLFTDGGNSPPTITQGSIVESPSEGETGLVEGNAGVVKAGASVSLEFAVMLD